MGRFSDFVKNKIAPVVKEGLEQAMVTAPESGITLSPEEWQKAINAQGVNPDTAPKISNVQVPDNYPKNWSQYLLGNNVDHNAIRMPENIVAPESGIIGTVEDWRNAIDAKGVNNVEAPAFVPMNLAQHNNGASVKPIVVPTQQLNPNEKKAAVQEAITMQQAAPTNSGVDPEIQAAIDAKKNQGQQRSSTPVVTTPVVETPASSVQPPSSSVQTPAATTQIPVQGGFTVPADQPQQTEGEKKAQKDPNAIDFFNQILGPTPAEREAQQQRLLKQKRNMIAWTGLFDGLRQLANLYTASRGANNMQFTDNPYQTIEQAYQAEQKRQDANQAYANAYAKQMKEYKRQADQDKMAKEKHKAILNWYDTRDEITRTKAENDRLKAEAAARVSEAREENIRAKTKQINELTPYQKKKLIAATEKLHHDANRPYGGGRGRSGGRSSSDDPFTELANLLYDDPDIIGPILEKEGFGYYNADTKDFDFRKNVTKGMAKTANQQANRQINQKGLRSAKSKVSIR